jgi:hypothetical protein
VISARSSFNAISALPVNAILALVMRFLLRHEAILALVMRFLLDLSMRFCCVILRFLLRHEAISEDLK